LSVGRSADKTFSMC